MSNCRNGHLIAGPQDRDNHGQCRVCQRAAAARYRLKCQNAVTIVKAIESTRLLGGSYNRVM